MIKLIRKCRWCDNGMGKVNGEPIHVNGLYCCYDSKGRKDTVAE